MRGFAMLAPNKVGWVEKEEAKIGARDALLRPVAIAPCTTDVHSVWDGLVTELAEPRIIGHEGVGQIVKIGSDVKDFKVGDIVIVPSLTPDWNKPESQIGLASHCGGFLGGYNLANTDDGCFGETYIVRDVDGNVAHIPDGVRPEQAAMCSDMMATGFTATNAAKVGFGDTVCVIGIGPVGLMAVAGCRMRGASYIFAVGRRPRTQEAAKFYGAHKVFNYTEGDIADQLLDYTGGKPVDKVIIAGGNAGTYAQALRMVKVGGVVSNVAFLSDAYGDIVIPMSSFGGGIADKKIVGFVTVGGRAAMEAFARLLAAGRLDVDPLLTHTYSGLEGVEDALYIMRDKPDDLIKPIVKINWD